MRGLAPVTKELIRLAQQVLKENHPQTLRQMHYAISSLGLSVYQNELRFYRKLSRVLTEARRLYRKWELDCRTTIHDQTAARLTKIPVDHVVNRRMFESGYKLCEILDPPELAIDGDLIVDELRQGEYVSVWENAADYIETIRSDYRRNYWQDQPHYCEVWGEKATVLGTLRPIANEWGITLRVCRGFGSAGMENVVGKLFEDVDKPITIFYIGDHDASGVTIDPDMHRRAQTAAGRKFKMVRLAIFAEDIQKFNLPPQKIKDTDTRAPAFRKKFGKNAKTVELEALPVAELKRRIVKAIRKLIDFERWDRQTATEEVEFESITRVADAMKNLPQAEV